MLFTLKADRKPDLFHSSQEISRFILLIIWSSLLLEHKHRVQCGEWIGLRHSDNLITSKQILSFLTIDNNKTTNNSDSKRLWDMVNKSVPFKKPKYFYRFHITMRPDHILSQANAIHTHISCTFKNHLKYSPHLCSGFARARNKNCIYFSCMLHGLSISTTQCVFAVLIKLG
jgi:hypothetical protein